MERVSIKVRPNSPKNEIISGDEIIVKIRALPEGNKANIELVKFLSKAWKKKARIVAGHNSRKKIIEIA